MTTLFGADLALFSIAGCFVGSWLDDLLEGEGIWLGVTVFCFLMLGSLSVYILFLKILESWHE